ncbi:hypothetical protein PSE_1201 [Pseudovibrio sp. FO-BEG1]|uniref:hypothetical protein n=1 Tax=Pseudovibrio sp. (strain FO-BEG1) TaxID=911045 RepID=UPI000238CFCB|nr:hypothetical protein [Pseudovibrio sp. FO-BEG1]AEV35713.1 hypothetical protein PSE_1201 [Pseudovibrio sp. FO-BEG1]
MKWFQEFRRTRKWKWGKRLAITAIIFAVLIDLGLRGLTKAMWKPLSASLADERPGHVLAEEYWVDQKAWHAKEQKEDAARPCLAGVKTIPLRLQLTKGIDYLDPSTTRMIVSVKDDMGSYRGTTTYMGPLVREVNFEARYCPDELNVNDPFHREAHNWFYMIAVDMEKGRYINFDAEESYPIGAWRDVIVELYPWGEQTLDPGGKFNGHHIYPADPKAVVPERYRRKVPGPSQLAPWR